MFFAAMPESGKPKCRLLRYRIHTGAGVAEVAREVGYQSPTSFTAAFSRACGMSPKLFKQSVCSRFLDVGKTAANGGQRGE